MGYELDRFVDRDVAMSLTCAICHNVLCIEDSRQEPKRGQKDGHKFCKSCIQKWLKQSNSCPVCAKPIKKLEYLDWFTRNVHINLKIHCKYQKEGCEFVNKLESIQTHEMYCGFGPRKCIKCNSLYSKSAGHSEKDCIFGLIEWLEQVPENSHNTVEILKNSINKLLSRKDEEIEALEAKLSLQVNNNVYALQIQKRDPKSIISKLKLKINKNDMPKMIRLCSGTALYEISKKRHLNIVQLLLDDGIKINDKESGNNTTLIFASSQSHRDVDKLFAENGANLIGQSAIYFAKDNEIIEYLYSHNMI